MAEKNLRDNTLVTLHTSQLKHTDRQILAYYLAKNILFDAVTVRKTLLKSVVASHTVTKYETDALEQAETLDKELSAIEARGIQVVFLGEKGYPNALEDLEDAPAVLFVRSATDAEELFNTPGKTFVTVTGTRDADAYGLEMTEKVIENVPSVVVSGLAVGIDTKAHETALQKGRPTIAVLPSSLDNIYPAHNRQLADTLATTPGCALVSPFTSGIMPEASSFIYRNHILAGLSQSTVIVECREKGGAMVTAKLAHSYGKNVYAVPGRIGDIRSEGCNRLIQDGTAQLF